jgi:hypothetical protein
MPYLQARRWVRDFAPLAGLPSQEFAVRVVSDLLRSGAARWEEDRLISAVPHSRVSCRRAPEVVGTVVARPVARSFKTVDSENYYGPMYDSTVLCEWPKREG